MQSGDELAAIEEWFVARGVPHFVERRPSAWDIWGRAIPLLVAAYLLLGLNALDLADWSWRRNVLAALFVVAVLVLTWVGANLLRGRRPLQRPDTIGPVELALLVVAPAIPSAIFGQWGDVAQTVVEGVLVLLAVWALTSYGVLPLLAWAGHRTSSQLPAFLNLIFRALPLLLLFMTFLFVNAEVWEVAGTLTGPVYVVVLAVFFALGNIFLLSRLPALMRAQNTFADWAEVTALVTATRVVSDGFVRGVAGDGDAVPEVARPSIRQRLNIGLVAVFSQAIQITAMALAMFGFFVLFGFLAISAEIAAGWTGSDAVHVLADVTFGGRRLVISEPLLRVAGFLGAFAGMYFTVVLSTDATYREEFAEDIGPDLHQALAMRVLYRTALAAS
ncbi:MAG TPA: hypothetical protein VFO97_06830 [Desertimonas sp.]|nr:hypothetical protein [Desertimonas sp.]